MVCADTSSLDAYWAGSSGLDVEIVERALEGEDLALAPVCLCELLCSPHLSAAHEQALLKLPLLDVGPGYWERAGRLRANLIRKRYKPKVADTLIAQSCLDHDVPLITRDRDFAPFQKLVGLRLFLPEGRVQ